MVTCRENVSSARAGRNARIVNTAQGMSQGRITLPSCEMVKIKSLERSLVANAVIALVRYGHRVPVTKG